MLRTRVYCGPVCQARDWKSHQKTHNQDEEDKQDKQDEEKAKWSKDQKSEISFSRIVQICKR